MESEVDKKRDEIATCVNRIAWKSANIALTFGKAGDWKSLFYGFPKIKWVAVVVAKSDFARLLETTGVEYRRQVPNVC